jgi:hypothetical protein
MTKDATLIVNPFLDLKLVQDESGVRAVTIHAPVKGESLRVTTIDRDRDPGIFALLVIYCYSATKRAHLPQSATEQERERLTAIGFLVRENQVPNSISYACDFIDEPSNLLPRRARQQLSASLWNDDLIVDPTFNHLGRNALTPKMRGYDLSDPFRRDRSWFSIENGLSAPDFYSYTADPNTAISLLVAGQRAPRSLPSSVRQKLVEADVLRVSRETKVRCERRECELARVHTSLVKKRYVVLREIIHAVQLAAIRRYYRQLIDEGFVRFGDQEWPNRFFSARDGLAYFFQQQLTTLIGEIAGEKVKPSFCFFASYRPGSDLKAHRDREQCHYALTVLLDHDLAEDVSSWPIYVQPSHAPEALPINLGLGDGLLYFGEQVLHYRPLLTEGHSTHWFLFWVPNNFERSLD